MKLRAATMSRRARSLYKASRMWIASSSLPCACSAFPRSWCRRESRLDLFIQNGAAARLTLRQWNEFVVSGNRAVLLRAPFRFGVFNALTRACDEIPPDEALAAGLRAADQHYRRRASRPDRRRPAAREHGHVRLGQRHAVDLHRAGDGVD